MLGISIKHILFKNFTTIAHGRPSSMLLHADSKMPAVIHAIVLETAYLSLTNKSAGLLGEFNITL